MLLYQRPFDGIQCPGLHKDTLGHGGHANIVKLRGQAEFQRLKCRQTVFPRQRLRQHAYTNTVPAGAVDANGGADRQALQRFPFHRFAGG